jgi:hypothetical protein
VTFDGEQHLIDAFTQIFLATREQATRKPSSAEIRYEPVFVPPVDDVTTIDFRNGMRQQFVLDRDTTIAIHAPSVDAADCHFLVMIQQGATGRSQVRWPKDISWGPSPLRHPTEVPPMDPRPWARVLFRIYVVAGKLYGELLCIYDPVLPPGSHATESEAITKLRALRDLALTSMDDWHHEVFLIRSGSENIAACTDVARGPARAAYIVALHNVSPDIWDENTSLRAQLAQAERYRAALETAGDALLDSLGEFVRQSMHANREWQTGIEAWMETSMASKKARIAASASAHDGCSLCDGRGTIDKPHGAGAVPCHRDPTKDHARG